MKLLIPFLLIFSITAKAQKFDCNHETDFIIHISAGTPFNGYAEAGFMREHIGAAIGIMQYTPKGKDVKGNNLQDQSAIYARIIAPIFKYDSPGGFVYRIYGTGFAGQGIAGGSIRFGISAEDENLMLIIEPMYLDGFRGNIGLALRL